MALDSEQFRQIHDALLDGYDELALRQMVRFGLGEGLDRIAGGANLDALVFSLIEWAERTGRERDLVRAATHENPTNVSLAALRASWFPPETPDAPAGERATDADAPQVFLSYSRRDSETMRLVLRELVDAGLSVWTDDGLTPGSRQWQAEIERAIQRTRCLAVLLSPHAKASEWVNIEVSYALELGHSVFPLLIAGSKPSAVLLSLWNHQYVDGTRELSRSVQQRLAPAMREHLGLAAAGPVREARLPKTPIDFDWVQIPAGEFVIGSTEAQVEAVLRQAKEQYGDIVQESWYTREIPQHTRYLRKFFITRTPVTVAQFDEFLRATGYRTTAENEGWSYGWTGTKWDRVDGASWNHPNGPESDVAGKAQHPVTHISWNDARAFCDWANVLLPSEAQWEKAARGIDGRIYPWGDEPPDESRCNFDSNVGDTTPVGNYPVGASPYGLLDMAGSVWEWTSSKFVDYPYDADDGREDPAGDADRVLRGGSFGHRHFVRCAFRNDGGPFYRSRGHGFRVLSPGP